MENHLVANTSCSQVDIEAAANHYVANVDVQDLLPACPCRPLNVKLNTMLGSRVLYDMDIMDLVGLLEEMGVRNQWKLMNARIVKELEGISQHVEESVKILGENPPPYVSWRNREPTRFDEAVITEARQVIEEQLAQEVVVAEKEAQEEVVVEQAVAEPEEVKEEVVVKEEERPIFCSLRQWPWGRWNYWYNHEVANHRVDEIRPQLLEAQVRTADLGSASFGTWDNLMDDVIAWHKRGLNRFHVRMCLCQSNGQ